MRKVTTIWINAEERKNADKIKQILETALRSSFPIRNVKIGKTFLNQRYMKPDCYAAKITVYTWTREEAVQ